MLNIYSGLTFLRIFYAKVPEDAPLETIIHRLVALDPDVSSDDSLDFAATEPITAVDKDGKEVIIGLLLPVFRSL